MQKSVQAILSRIAILSVFLGVVTPLSAHAQWSTTHEQFYFPGKFNWAFRHNYPAADGLFNAFDYGHAILYERLLTKPNAAAGLLETDEFNFITRKLLVNPPRLPLEETAIAIDYVKIAPEATMMFEWAHLLHRQIYDVWADERLSIPDKDAKVHELVGYYKTRKDLAFSSLPKNMDLMEGQPYSLAFRKRYPKFNGLIWAYHWLQIGLYEPLLAGSNRDERQTGVIATVARFRQMIEQPPTWMPRVMPMTPAVAPLFAARYPEAAIIFDNLHSMHDVISDILANPSVRRDQKGVEIAKAAKLYRDSTSFLMTRDEWREMATMMGVENMGGPVRGFLAQFPTPTVERGAVMNHSAMPGMSGMQHGTAAAPGSVSSAPNTSHVVAPPGAVSSMPGMDHSSMPGMSPTSGAATTAPVTSGSSSEMKELHARMMADPVIRGRINADPTLRRLMERAVNAPRAAVPAKKKTVTAKRPAPVKKAATAKKPSTAPTAAKPKPKPQPDPHAGMDHGTTPTPKKK